MLYIIIIDKNMASFGRAPQATRLTSTSPDAIDGPC